ncbi:uncharacterized protein LOC143422351 [Xylocopa sonorina]|uniref:uncharacterized protein LOC143422351 n=1 Tax=Xylocopa sonorina TaxID=1818115 RepID=UPI00403ACF79
MSWVPPNLSNLCSSHSTVSTCQPPTFMFLALVAQLFSHPKDPYQHPLDAFHPLIPLQQSDSVGPSTETEIGVRCLGDSQKGRVQANYLLPNLMDVRAPVKLATDVYGSRFQNNPGFLLGVQSENGNAEVVNVQVAPSTVNLAEVYSFHPGTSVTSRPVTSLATFYDGVHAGEEERTLPSLMDFMFCCGSSKRKDVESLNYNLGDNRLLQLFLKLVLNYANRCDIAIKICSKRLQSKIRYSKSRFNWQLQVNRLVIKGDYLISVIVNQFHWCISLLHLLNHLLSEFVSKS